MEQAVNQFNKGLQTDTHPMIQGNDTLSDALNATFVTMNGNEVILQNDMGNRRVDNAYLPSGYEPVGIKEYGGIIYIAAYNPITNKSQIGSFPSPERKLSKDDFSDDLKGTLDLDQFIENKSSYKDQIQYLNQDTFLIPLTSDVSLHAGDKFVVYCKDLETYGQDITNYFNISNNKVNSPKNRKYTLSLGILNSQNEFVDITKTLCRWRNTSIINYENGESDLYKFNDGYFIASDKPENLLDQETIDDANLIKNRQIMEANTYSYKLIGPLYLKCTLNHIQNFNYNIYGSISSQGKIDLTIEGYITYNCPDWIKEPKDIGDDNYKFYETGVIKDGWFDLYCGIDNEHKNKIDQENNIYNINEETVYDINTNLYTVKVVKTFKNITYNTDTNYLYYTIGIIPNSKVPENVYLSNLSEEGVIDVKKLGNGTIDLTGWRFYNKDNNTVLTYSFDSYPKYGYSFKDLKMVFKEVYGGNTITIENDEVFNGKTNLQLDWGTYEIKQRTLYSVTITVKQYENGKNQSNDEFEFVRWFIATDLMNDCYYSSSDNYIKDFGNPSDDLNIYTGKSEKDTLDNKLKLKLFFDTRITDNSTINYNNSPDSKGTNWVTQNTPNINVIYRHIYNINYQINSTLKINNEDSYPSFIKISNPYEQYKLEIKDENKKLIFEDDITYTNKGEQSFSENETFIKQTKDLAVNNNTNITGKIEFFDKFKSNGIEDDVDIIHPFGKVSEYLGKSIFKPSTESLPLYMGVGLDYDRDGYYLHFLNFFWSKSSNSVKMDHTGMCNDQEYAENIGNATEDGTIEFSGHTSDIMNAFDSKAGSNVVFTYIFQNSSTIEHSIKIISKEGRNNILNSSIPLSQNARVWWRTSGGNETWATFENPIKKGENLIDFIIQNVFKGNKNIVYCFADSISGKSHIIIPNIENSCVYNNPYTFTSNIYFTIKSVNADKIDILGSNTSLIKCMSKHNKDKIIQYELNFYNNNSDNIEYNEIIPIQVNSSKQFYKDVNSKFGGNQVSNMYIDTGITTDIDGNQLDINSFYEITSTGGLKKVEFKNVKIAQEYGNEGYRTILYSGSDHWEYVNPGKNKYDAITSDHDHGETYLSYAYVTLVSVKKE